MLYLHTWGWTIWDLSSGPWSTGLPDESQGWLKLCDESTGL